MSRSLLLTVFTVSISAGLPVHDGWGRGVEDAGGARAAQGAASDRTDESLLEVLSKAKTVARPRASVCRG